MEDLSLGEVALFFYKTKQLKRLHREGAHLDILQGKSLAMIFHKASTRTRVSFEAGITQLGGHALFLDNASTQMGRGEPIKDTARVLSRYVDAIMIRTFKQELVEELANYASIPVINGLTDASHPCQALADVFTALERFKVLKGRKFVYIGDANNVANSLLFACAKVGMDIVICSPEGYGPSEDIMIRAKASAGEVGGKVGAETDPNIAARGADVLYTDVWTSMGQEAESDKRRKDLKDYRINSKLLSQANKDCIVMHCLPAHRGEEIDEDVFEGPQSAVFEEAENRLHVQKAIMALLMSDKEF
jgi:ornithine carbamoyltransferase